LLIPIPPHFFFLHFAFNITLLYYIWLMMTSDLSALASIGFIKPLSSHSDFCNWLFAATDIFAEKDWLALIESKEPRPAATNDGTGLAPTSFTPSSSASTSSGASIDTTLDESLQAWDTKATMVRGLLRRMLDANHREMYSTERDPVTVWKMLKERDSIGRVLSRRMILSSLS
jgi:hypothetical protein